MSFSLGIILHFAIFRMAARRKANILGARNMNTGKPLPAILSRKRKNDEDDPMQPVSVSCKTQRVLKIQFCFILGY